MESDTSNVLSVENLTYKVGSKVILSDISFKTKPGRLLTVLGLSGSGKTTLLKCIAGYVPENNMTGSVLYNNVPLNNHESKCLPCTFLSEKPLLPNLTVRETLLYTIKLHFPNESSEYHKANVDKIIQDLSLTNCEHNYIGNEIIKGTSSGESKRIAIGIELTASPLVALFSSPVDALDSALAYEIILILKSLSQNGYTVIITEDQPTSQMWEKYDDVALLKNGVLLYYGDKSNILPYFEEFGYSCPSDTSGIDYILATLEDKDLPKFESEAKPVKKKNSNQTSESNNEFYLAYDNSLESMCKSSRTWFYKLYLLFCRSFLNHIRNRTLCWTLLFLQIIQAIFFGFFFFKINKDFYATPAISSELTSPLKNPLINLIDLEFKTSRYIEKMLLKGVDFQGSHVLFDLFNDENSLNSIFNILKCYTNSSLIMDSKKITKKDLMEAFIGMVSILSDRSTALTKISYCMFNTKLSFNPISTEEADKLLNEFASKVTLNTEYNEAYDGVNNFTAQELKLSQIRSLQETNDISAAEFNLRYILNSIETLAMNYFEKPILVGKEFYKILLDYHKAGKCKSSLCLKIYDYIKGNNQEFYLYVFNVFHIAIFLGVLFMIVAYIGFGNNSCLFTLAQEMPLVTNEIVSNLYSPAQYFIAKTTAELPINLFFAFITISINYFLIAIGTTAAHYFSFVGVTLLIVYAAQSFAFLLAIICDDLHLSVFVSPLLQIILLSISGFYISDSNLSAVLNLWSSLDIYKWGFLSYVYLQYPRNYSLNGIPTELALSIAGAHKYSLTYSVVALFLVGTLYRLIAFGLFCVKFDRKKLKKNL